MQLSARITLAVTVLLVAAIVHLIARARTPGRLFWVPLGRELTAGDQARIHRVLTVNAIAAVLGVTLSVLATQGWVLALVASVLPLVLIGWMLVEMAGVLRTVPPPAASGRFVVPLDAPPPVTAYVSAPLEVANVAVVLLGAALFGAVRSSLPARIPMHFNARGQADRYGSPGELWSLVGTEVFLLVLLWIIAWAVARERWALPEREQERYAATQLRRRRLMVRFIETMFLGLNLSFTLMVLAVALGSDPARRWLISAGVVASVVLMAVSTLAPLTAFLPALIRVQDELGALSGSEVLGTRASGWRWGGAIYYAPEDPALFVPKWVGIGQTLNFARPMAGVFLVGVIVLPLAISLLALKLGR